MLYFNLLKEFRESQGLTQSEFAKKINYTLSLYEKVESGRINASSNFMKAIKQAFPSISIDYIFFSFYSDKIAIKAK